MNRWYISSISLAAALTCSVHFAVAQSTDTAKVAVDQSDEYGAYLVDAEGRTLYLFTADQQGSGETQAMSNCYDDCATAWPPLTIQQDQPQAGEQVEAPLLGTVERKDGSLQVTYNGWPLYYFAKDQGPGEVTGQDKHGFGGEWYLVSPKGGKVEKES